jgi:hypothetical protein
VTRKSITTNGPVIACDVCGRTLLRGEHPDVFLHGGVRRNVCELCTQRAAHEGWIREGLDDVTARAGAGGGRSRSLLGRLRHRRGDGARATAAVAAEPEPEPVAPPPPEPPMPEPVAHEQRSVHAVPTNADLKMARALDLFNSSPHPRTVAGVARSLGAPIVAVRPSATEGSVVAITVAWELSWYRYEIDLADEAAGPRVVGQGTELSELDAADQVPNAAADDHGALQLAVAHAS